MRPLVFHNLLAGLLLGGSFVLAIAIESTVRRRSRMPGGERVRDWTLLLIGIVLWPSLAVSAYVAVEHAATLPGGGWWPVALGVGMMWTGFAVRLWSILTLGRFFQLTVVVQDGHEVVRDGPYRWLRHPGYLGIIVSNTGIGMAMGDWVSAAVMLATTLVVFLVRIRVEERALLDRLGEEYARYASATARLLPGVY